jgi:hypothetical protein
MCCTIGGCVNTGVIPAFTPGRAIAPTHLRSDPSHCQPRSRGSWRCRQEARRTGLTAIILLRHRHLRAWLLTGPRSTARMTPYSTAFLKSSASWADAAACDFMSDQWIFFPCQMGEHRASIFYDHGIRESIDSIAPPYLLKVRAAFKQPRPDGMPTNEEFPHLTALENGLQALVQQHDSLYVGRVTVDRCRHFYIYTADSEEVWASRLDRLGASHGYELALAYEPDERRDGYWKELFPTDDDWQVIKDLRVIEVLQEEGDDGTASRQVDHWAYFSSQAAADSFSNWVHERGYVLVSTDIADDGEICVCFWHRGTIELADITSHTITLCRKANELGGNYDGWETPVCNKSA